MAKAKGSQKTPGSGRKKGTPNKGTAEIRKAFQAHGPAMLKKLVALANSKNETIVLAACNSILDRGHGRPVQALSGPDGEKLAVAFTMNLAPEK